MNGAYITGDRDDSDNDFSNKQQARDQILQFHHSSWSCNTPSVSPTMAPTTVTIAPSATAVTAPSATAPSATASTVTSASATSSTAAVTTDSATASNAASTTTAATASTAADTGSLHQR